MTQLSEAEQAMLTRLAGQEGPHFRHQTRDEAPLTAGEKVSLAGALLQRNPGEFLARYARFLNWPADAECFRAHWDDDYTVRFYLEEAGVNLSVQKSQGDSNGAPGPTQLNAAQCRRIEMQKKNRRLVVSSLARSPKMCQFSTPFCTLDGSFKRCG